MGLSMLKADRADRALHYFEEAQRFLMTCNDALSLASVHYALGYWALDQQNEHLAIEHFEESLNHSQNHNHLLQQSLMTRLALARLTRLNGSLEQAERAFNRIHSDAIDANLEVCSLEAKLGLGLCAWRKEDATEALAYFSEVRRSARGNLFILEFYASIGEAWSYARQQDWDQSQVALFQAESLRLDVLYRDKELEELRLSIKSFAQHYNRLDLISQVERLSNLSLGGNTTYQTDIGR